MQRLARVVYIFAILAFVECEYDTNYYTSKYFRFVVHHRTHFFLQPTDVTTIGKGTISHIYDMESFILYGPTIQEIEPGAFQNLPRLKSLSIMNCYISRIDAGVFNNLNVTELAIKENRRPLSLVGGAFDNMTSLQKLRLDRIQLSTWDPPWFVNTPQLKEIYACGNLLTEIPGGAFQNRNSDNEITINFADGQISKVHYDAFRGIKKMKELSLQHNKLEEFSSRILKNIEIGELRISNNKFECLNESEFADIFVANKTAIGGNPWRPDCLQKILEWGMSHNKTIQNTDK
ncbi:hypothetical protein Zmor_026170 [Zophobas morio]|uniref:Uncharacterized protein n=1 Tax=Zophobas morio TaxID=2755281 RepID=A0AA38M4B6_9CUCU|nr:hypothetical protein Zmor_026170 [Zophobas morio]